MEKHLVPFSKVTFKMTLVFLLLHAILIHDKILFESMENGHANYEIGFNLLECIGELIVDFVCILLQRESCEW
jgi:hypothetical protein